MQACYWRASEYAEGKKAGLKGIGITCHSPMPGNFSSDVRMTQAEFLIMLRWLKKLHKISGNFEVLGIESDGFQEWRIG